jgi:hypothetical protein
MILSKLLDHYARYQQHPSRPSDFAWRYKHMDVYGGPKGQQRVSVHKYRMNTDDPADLDEAGRIRDHVADHELGSARWSIQRWARALDETEDTGFEAAASRLGSLRMIASPEGGPRRLRRVFLGKGSPRDIALTLGLLNASGRLADVFPGLGEQAAMQSYCDRFIGLDCSGFVNNYFTAIGRRPDDLTDRPTIAMHARQGRRLAAVAGSPRNHVFCWVNGESRTAVAPGRVIRFGHILAIDEWVKPPDPATNDPAGARFRCTQSSASLGGITTQIYEILQGPSPGPRAHTWRIQRVPGTGDNVLEPARLVWNDVFLAAPM